jgi:predicted transcriptional regulator
MVELEHDSGLDDLIAIDGAVLVVDPLGNCSGRAKSNLSRTLKSMERFGLVELLKEEGSAMCPHVPYKEIQIDLPFAHHQRGHFEALR